MARQYTDAEIRAALVEWGEAEEDWNADTISRKNEARADRAMFRMRGIARDIARSLRTEQKAREAGKGKG